jgi:hypothetical protein
MVPQTEPSPEDVFINCPFDSDYRDIFRALIFVIRACGFQPRSARELGDGGKTRIAKLYDIIEESRYGIHDISRTELDATHQLPRFNMPLELGIFLGAKQYGGPSQRRKLVLIFDTEPYRFQKFISDLAGMDIHAHGGDVEIAISKTRDWLVNVSRKQLPGDKGLIRRYHEFLAELPSLANKLDLDAATASYVDFEKMLEEWLLSTQAVSSVAVASRQSFDHRTA